MPKVSELTAITNANVATTDKVVLLDVSDTTQAASGTVKNLLVSELDNRYYTVCTSSTRPASPFDGQCIYETDTDKLRIYNGTSWWTVGVSGNNVTSYTPVTLTQSSSVTNTVLVSEYQIINGVCEWWFCISATASGTGGIALYLTLPVTSAAADSRHCGAGAIFDVSASELYSGSFEMPTTNTIGFVSDGSVSAYWGSSPNIAIASGDTIRGHVRYRVASAA